MSSPAPFLVAIAINLCAATTIGAAAQNRNAEELTGCASNTPPFVVMKSGVATSGLSFELFQFVARQMGRAPKVGELPWARCLSDVKAGRIDVAIDAYEDADRRRSFLYSSAYYTLTPQIFYRRSASNSIFPVSNVKDLGALKGCGVHEYTYEHYDLDARTLDRGATNNLQMLQKLKYGRCDFALEELEYIIGSRDYSPSWLDETDIQSFRPTWARGPTLHFLVGKAHVHGEELMREVNSGIDSARKTGAAKALQTEYFQRTKKQAVKD